MAVNTDRDDDVVDRYRAASAELDERPAASVRASVLAAAARQVGAKPVDAAKYRRPRWPLAAAATVMLSTLAVMLAVRTQDEMPQFDAPAQQTPAAERAAPTPPAVEPSPRSQPALDQAVPQNRPSPARAERPASRARSESNGFADSPSEAKSPAAPAAVPANDAAPAAAAPPPAPKTSARANSRAEESESVKPARPLDQAGVEARRDAAQGASVQSAETDESAAAWLERIIKLRRDGQHDEADVEIKRFRERYPQVQLPPEALAGTGTR